jgi:PAS domain-containing protein
MAFYEDPVGVFPHEIVLFQAILDGMTDGVVVADAAGNPLLWNAAAQKIVGPVDPRSSRAVVEPFWSLSAG